VTAIKYLCQGLESKKKITLLLKLTSTKENIQGGIFDHLVNNLSISQSAMLNNLTPGNLSVAIKDLNAIAEVVEKINEFNVYDKSHTK
tara:strand:- start:2317 stop:2580 length:264 start_codon:yes stop_codon:yes gene_type:complete